MQIQGIQSFNYTLPLKHFASLANNFVFQRNTQLMQFKKQFYATHKHFVEIKNDAHFFASGPIFSKCFSTAYLFY